MAKVRNVKLKDHTILALDVGTRFIKMAELRLNKGVIQLLNVAMAPTPAGMLDNAQLIDPVGLGKFVRDVWQVNQFSAKKAVVSINGQSSVVVRPIDLPKMTKKELKDTMKFEVERHIPFSADEIYMDYVPLVAPEDLPDGEENMRVLLAVAQEELIYSYLKMLKVAGLTPIALDVQILAVIRSMIDINREEGSYDDVVTLVNIGAGFTEISIVDKGMLTFVRVVPIGGDALTGAIADQMGRSFEEAEELKIEHGKVFLDSTVGELPMPTEDMSYNPYGDMPVEDSFVLPIPPQLFTLEEAEPVAETPFISTVVELDDNNVPFVSSFDDEERSPGSFSLDDDGSVTPPAFADFDAGAMPADENTGEAPLFDFGSEVQSQMPAPLSRPATNDDDVPSMFSSPTPALGAIPEDDLLSSYAATPFIPEGINPPADDLLAEYAATPFIPGHDADDSGFERPDSSRSDIFQRRIAESMLPTIGELVMEIRRSLEYYGGREPDSIISTVYLYGGGSRLPNLSEFITQELGVKVITANPLPQLDISALRQPAEYVEELTLALPVCIGLGLRDMLV